ncbi:MAG: ATP-binding protein [Alphaproteobacteria bacterium]
MSAVLNPVTANEYGAPGAVERLNWQTPLSVRYEDMLRSSVDWLWEVDERIRFTYVSPPIASCLGVPAKQLIGCDLFGIAGGEQPANGGVYAAVEARRAFRAEEAVLDAGGGHHALCRLTGLPFYDIAGRFAGYRGTGTAIDKSAPHANGHGDDAETNRQLMDVLEAALARKDELELERSESAQGSVQSRLVAVAHELRTPLAAIIGFAETLRDRHFGDDPDRYAEYGGNIHYSAVHMLELVENLMAMAGTAQPGQNSADAREIVAGSVCMLEGRAAGAGVELASEIPSDLPRVKGEPRALRQIVLNLLSNAIAFTPPGGRAGVAGRRAADGTVELAVWDTGIGIPEQEHERIFDYAYRVEHDAPTLTRSGSGLGLALSRDLARALGGDINVASEPGRGSRFTLRLPAAALVDP